MGHPTGIETQRRGLPGTEGQQSRSRSLQVEVSPRPLCEIDLSHHFYLFCEIIDKQGVG